MPGSFIDQRWEEVRKQSKKVINLTNISQNVRPQAEDVLISSFLSSTGGQGSEQRRLSVTVRRGAGFPEAAHSVCL